MYSPASLRGAGDIALSCEAAFDSLAFLAFDSLAFLWYDKQS
jgi:hypothetical protein